MAGMSSWEEKQVHCPTLFLIESFMMPIINIESIDPSKDISMREVYGLDKSLIE